MEQVLDQKELLLLLQSVALGVFAVDKEWKITFFNREAERITGFSSSEALGKPCRTIFRSDRCERCYLKKAMESGRNLIKVRLSILNKKHRRVPLEITAAVQRDETGDILGGVESFLDLSARQALEHSVRQSYRYYDLVGCDRAMRDLFDTVDVVARTEATVLLKGETGTGKSLLAKVLHNASARADKPFIKVNCAAIPDNLLESELFGYRKGAFTDAQQDKPGLFSLASGGTLFLDEVGDIPLNLQAKLFQVLDEGSYLPLGATVQERVNVRIIAATNLDLEGKVAVGEFRVDLFFRLRVVELTIPALRNRCEDIPVLIDHFLAEFTALHGNHVEGPDRDALHLLLNYPFPGNVRELRHAIEHGVILTTQDSIRVRDLPAYMSSPSSRRLASPTARTGPTSLAAREQEMLRQALDEHAWRRGETAKSLGVDRTTLWRRMKRAGLA